MEAAASDATAAAAAADFATGGGGGEVGGVDAVGRHQHHHHHAAVRQLISSDEAPDTGDDSDEDLITSYLAGSSSNNASNGVVVNSSGNSNNTSRVTVGGVAMTGHHHGSASTQRTTGAAGASHSPNGNHILDDTLTQLAQIHENIQRMRIENAAETARLGLGLPKSDSRLTSSCPSLNDNDRAAAAAGLGVGVGGASTSTATVMAALAAAAAANNGGGNKVDDLANGNDAAPPYVNTPLTTGATRISRKKPYGAGDAKSRGKRPPGGGRAAPPPHRSLSASSNDSDLDDIDSVNPNLFPPPPPPPPSQMTANSDTVDFVDGMFSKCHHHHRPRSSSTQPKHSHHHHFKTPPEGSSKMPRPPTSSSSGKKGHHQILSQFPGLHKSVSTPSIAVEHPLHHHHGHKAGRASKNATPGFPEPTHVFLQKLISEHEWTRRSGTDTDSEEDLHHHSHQQHPQHPHASVSAQNSAAAASVAAGVVGPHQSPQISLAEFLQDAPNLEDDPGQHGKRRRKKERSSIFFRKKNKDKNAASTASSGKAQFGAHGHHHTAPVIGAPFNFHHGENSGGVHHSRMMMMADPRSLGKAPSAASLATAAQQQQHQRTLGKVPQHSYSMSSLRKSTSHQPNYHVGSNFYVARGEMSSPRQHLSNWTRVGRKLGVIKVTADERDDFGGDDTQGLIQGEFGPSVEFPEGGPAAIRNLDTDPFLRIQDEEAESWQQNFPPEAVAGLSATEVKRQDHMYEFIRTESNHCQVLMVIQKIFVEGMFKYLNMSRDVVDKIFPCIDDMVKIHFRFLEQLRRRQAEKPVVDSIADILIEQFSGDLSRKWREAYGTFCSQHNESVALYKDLLKSDRQFQQFVKQCSLNPLLKKKGVPECILFVTTRITKYPLLIEPLVKTARDLPVDQCALKEAHVKVRDILKDVNARVAEKERERRFLEIYKSIDAKSSASHKGRKFKKSDLYLDSRKLKFEGTASLVQHAAGGGPPRVVPLVVVVLSDVLFFLHENNQKYYFWVPEGGKPSVVPVSTLVVNDRPHFPGASSTKSVQLMSIRSTLDNVSAEAPDVFDLEITQPPTREDWVAGIREAVDASASDAPEFAADGGAARRVDEKYAKLRQLTAEMRGRDLEMARAMEEQMRLRTDAMALLGQAPPPELQRETPPDYVGLVRPDRNPVPADAVGAAAIAGGCSKEELLRELKEASRLCAILNPDLASSDPSDALSSSSASVAAVGRSVSAAGNKNEQPPALPKRAETFGGFDQQPNETSQQPLSLRPEDSSSSAAPPVPPPLPPRPDKNRQPESASNNNQDSAISKTATPAAAPSSEAPRVALQVGHLLNRLTCLVSENFVSLESLKVEVAEARERTMLTGGRYRQNQLLEELRRMREGMGRERAAWAAEREEAEAAMAAKKQELERMQSEVESGLKDVKEQRDQLYRKLEMLKERGIVIGPNMSVLKTSSVSPAEKSASELLYYSEDRPLGGESKSQSASPTGTVNLGSTSSLRRPSASAISSVGLLSTSGLSAGGSLKKDPVVTTNLNLLSTTNEAKVAAVAAAVAGSSGGKSVVSAGGVGGAVEVKQQIPMKLSSKLSSSSSSSSMSRDRAGKKVSSSMMSKQPASLTNSSGLSSSMSNIAANKAAVLSEIQHSQQQQQQMLPFKLSEAANHSGSSGDTRKTSPKPGSGYQRLHGSGTLDRYQQQHPSQHHHQPSSRQHSHQHQHHHHQQQQQQYHSSHQRTGSSPASSSPNTSGQQPDEGEDKIIYF